VLLGLYVALIWLPLHAVADHERGTYGEIDEGIRSSFRRNLRRRGSYGHLEFLGVEERRHLLLSAAPGAGSGGASGSVAGGIAAGRSHGLSR
jgi:hypothetical protein